MRRPVTPLGLSLVGATLALATVFAQTPGPLPPVAGQMTVTAVTGTEALRPAEASVAINPTNPLHVIATLIQSNPPGRQPRSSNWGYVSTDGGRTWTGTPAANPGGRVQGDDVIAFGRDGTAFHSYIAFDGIRVEPDGLRVSADEIDSARVDPSLENAIADAISPSWSLVDSKPATRPSN